MFASQYKQSHPKHETNALTHLSPFTLLALPFPPSLCPSSPSYPNHSPRFVYPGVPLTSHNPLLNPPCLTLRLSHRKARNHNHSQPPITAPSSTLLLPLSPSSSSSSPPPSSSGLAASVSSRVKTHTRAPYTIFYGHDAWFLLPPLTEFHFVGRKEKNT